MNEYQRKKEKGVCVECGKKLEDRSKVKCQECSDKAKASYQFLKDHKICVNCNKAKAFGNTTLCPECLEKKSLYNARPETQERKNKENKRKYHERKEMGVCVKCGGELHSGSNVYCEKHYKMDRRKKKKDSLNRPLSNQTIWIENGLCRFCGGPVVEGKKMCKEHYDSVCAGLKKNRETSSGQENLKKHYWRKDNELLKRWGDMF